MSLLGINRGKKLFFIGLVVFALCVGGAGDAFAKSKAKTRKSKAKARTHHVLAVDSSSARYADIVIEASTGKVLHESNSTAIRRPASLTKMMTLYLAFQALESGAIRLDTPLPVSARAAAQAPTKLCLRAGQTIRAYDAIMGLITESANDAAVVLAEGLGGDIPRFAAMMTQQAKALGMSQTVFQNPNGLPDPNQFTTARDMAMLGYGLIYHFPGFYPYFSKQSFVYKGHTYNNHNHLMERFEGMDGIKTGYIRTSGFNLVASAMRGQTRLIGVVFGGTSAPSRDRQMEALLNDAFGAVSRQECREARALALPSKSVPAFAASSRPRVLRTQAGRVRTVLPDDSPVESALQKGEEGETQKKQSENDAWGIQVGAYSEIDGAQKALAQMASSMAPLLGKGEPSLQKVTMTDGSAMYRARFVGLEQSSARAACAHLVKSGRSCLVITGP
ncbi:MAG: D-alanyl-D-alanine carboxypeptidase [Bdellovibrionales bacterium]|jgi:D-alanyl-D-alanine carboxypeptidase